MQAAADTRPNAPHVFSSVMGTAIYSQNCRLIQGRPNMDVISNGQEIAVRGKTVYWVSNMGDSTAIGFTSQRE